MFLWSTELHEVSILLAILDCFLGGSIAFLDRSAWILKYALELANRYLLFKLHVNVVVESSSLRTYFQTSNDVS